MLNPRLFTQIDIGEPLKLSPKAFINRYDDNYFIIGIFDKDNATKFLSHMLTAIYIFCDWTKPEDLMLMWPPETINDLFEVIISLKKDKILLNETDYNSMVTDLTPKSNNEESIFIKEKNWIEKHLNAFKSIPEGAFILNQGAKAGGYLTLEMAKTINCKIVSTTENMSNALYTRKKAQEKNITNAQFIFCKPHNLSPICFADKFNVIFTELFNPGIFEERVLESIIYAKEHLATPDAMFIPAKINLKAFAYQSPIHRDMVQESKEFEILYGLKFGSFTEAMSKHIMGVYTRLDTENIIKLSDDYTIKSFDLKTLENHNFEEDFELTITKAGKVCGICTYFELELTDEIKISNSPYEDQNLYMQRIFTPAASIYLEESDSIKLKASYDNVFRILMPN